MKGQKLQLIADRLSRKERIFHVSLPVFGESVSLFYIPFAERSGLYSVRFQIWVSTLNETTLIGTVCTIEEAVNVFNGICDDMGIDSDRVTPN